MLTVAGDHVPVMPFVEIVGKVGATDPLHIGARELNVGVMLPLFTVTVRVVGLAHCPAPGVNV